MNEFTWKKKTMRGSKPPLPPEISSLWDIFMRFHFKPLPLDTLSWHLKKDQSQILKIIESRPEFFEMTGKEKIMIMVKKDIQRTYFQTYSP